MKYVAPGTTQITHLVGLYDAAGAPVLGKVATTFQTPLLVILDGAVKGTITIGNLASEGAAFSAGGMFEHGMGLYRVDFTVSGATGVYTLATAGTVGALITESVMVLDSTSQFMPSIVVRDNATTVRNVNVTQINSSGAAAASLALISNDTNNWLKVSPQINGVALVPADSSGVTSLLARLPGTLTMSAGAVMCGGFNGTFSASTLLISGGTVTLGGGIIANITGGVSGSVGSVTAAVTVGGLTDSTAWTDPASGPATGTLARINQLWQYFIGCKTVLDSGGSTLVMKGTDGTTTFLSMTATTAGAVQTKGAAS